MRVVKNIRDAEILINDLIRQGYLKSDVIIKAFSEIDRAEFVPEDLKDEAYSNIPLPLGYNQTISQPLTVAFMLELLDPDLGQNILDIGSGSGWTTALLSYAVGSRGKVTALETIPELCELGKRNTAKFNFIKKGIAEFYNIDGNLGYPKNAPYDRILVSAAAEKIPRDFKKQLKAGGILVIPVRDEIWQLKKKDKGGFKIRKYPGFSFVPLV